MRVISAVGTAPYTVMSCGGRHVYRDGRTNISQFWLIGSVRSTVDLTKGRQLERSREGLERAREQVERQNGPHWILHTTANTHGFRGEDSPRYRIRGADGPVTLLVGHEAPRRCQRWLGPDTCYVTSL